LFQKHKKSNQHILLLKQVYGDECLSCTQVFKQFGRFRDGQEGLNDSKRLSRQRTACDPKIIKKVHTKLQQM